VGGVIIGARLGKAEHIQDNLRLFDFELDFITFIKNFKEVCYAE